VDFDGEFLEVGGEIGHATGMAQSTIGVSQRGGCPPSMLGGSREILKFQMEGDVKKNTMPRCYPNIYRCIQCLPWHCQSVLILWHFDCSLDFCNFSLRGTKILKASFSSNICPDGRRCILGIYLRKMKLLIGLKNAGFLG
jgi:hypothetical protein